MATPLAHFPSIESLEAVGAFAIPTPPAHLDGFDELADWAIDEGFLAFADWCQRMLEVLEQTTRGMSEAPF